jgi:hypothetical protein
LIISNYYFFKTPAIRKIFPPKLKKKFPSPWVLTLAYFIIFTFHVHAAVRFHGV